MLDTRKHGQFVVDVISEMLDETKRVAEDCSVGTTSDDVRQALIYEEISRKAIPENLYLPRSYCAEVLEESYELVTNAELGKRVLRRMFRSVWDTAYSIKSHIETFIEDPRQISLRNALVMQRDLIDKIIDIPFIHRSGKSHQYLDFYAYVSAPQKMLHILPEILPSVVERGEDLGDTILPMTKAIMDPILLRLDIRHSVGLSGLDEQDVTTILGVIEILVESHAECTKLNDRIRDAREHHNVYDVLAWTKEWTLDLVQGLRRDMMHQLIAVFVRKYYHDDWGDWLEIPPDDQQKKLHNQLRSWTKVKHEKKLRDGLLRYIEKGFYDGGIKGHCAKLPYKYHLHSLHVHDSIWDSTHNKQEWEESSNSSDILDVLLDVCASAIYVASVHYYDCAEIRHELKSLRRILRKVEEQSTA